MVSILMVCCGLGKMTQACIASIYATSKDFEVLLFDNKGLNEAYLSSFSAMPNFKYFSSCSNLGYIFPMNFLASIAKGKYLVIANNDLLFTERGWLVRMISRLESGFGQVGPSLLHIGLDGNAVSTPNRPSYLEGWLFMIKQPTYVQLGLFDTGLSLFYCEDADLSLRLQKSHYKLCSLAVGVSHLRSATRHLLSKDFNFEEILSKNRQYLCSKWQLQRSKVL